ncbi:MAG: MgtC/SapB family protein [Pirellulales bacterium]
MEAFWQGVVADWPGTTELLDVIFRLSLAAIVGALPGLQREQQQMPAGLRTHMLVSVGTAVFMMASLEAGASVDAETRVVQGLATGVGFLGAGAILKSKDENEIRGLTTAASIWLTAGLGTAVGAGRIWLPIVGAIFGLVILSWLRTVEHAMGDHTKSPLIQTESNSEK